MSQHGPTLDEDQLRAGQGTPQLGIAVVAARFNHEITDEMVAQARSRVEELGHRLVHVVRVPGAFDVPLPTQTLLDRDDVDGVVVLGAVVTGETDHDQVLMHATARTLQQLSLETRKAIAFGITGPGMSFGQAKARIHYGSRAVDALVELVMATGGASGSQ